MPDSYKQELDDKRQRAFLYADESVAGLLDYLRNHTVLDNTLIIITADESRVFDVSGSPTYRDLILNWIPLIILTPQTKTQGLITESFSLMDIPKTILDYLRENIGNILGRSTLRSYSTMRPVLFGNIYKHHLFVKKDLDIIQKCNTMTYYYIDISTNYKNIFIDDYTITEQHPYFSNSIKNFIQQNDTD